ncbi:MAG: hypothetical protein H7Z14_20210, partial [Anaerolineae bacterium]|nr:hypothetical protein [Phycisphaerae bacterium]
MNHPRRVSVIAACGLALLTTLLTGSFASAHPAQFVAANLTVNRDGTFRVHARFDLLAFALNDTPARIEDAAMNELLDGSREDLEQALVNARQRLLRGVKIQCDGSTIVSAEAIQFPTTEDVNRWRDAKVLPRLPVMQEATLDGHLPAGTKSIAIRFPEVLGTLVLSIERPGEEAFSEPLEGGRYCSTLPIDLNSSLPNASSRHFERSEESRNGSDVN